MLLAQMGAFAEFERELLSQRQREGIEAAKKRGVYKGRQKKKLTLEQIEESKTRILAGETRTALAKEFGMERHTFSKLLKGAVNAG